MRVCVCACVRVCVCARACRICTWHDRRAREWLETAASTTCNEPRCPRLQLLISADAGAAAPCAGTAAADGGGPRSGGRLAGSVWGRKKEGAEFDATREEKESWLEAAKDLASRVHTPGITWNLKPQRTHLKLRKIFYPLGITKLAVGADFDPLEVSWRVHTSWRDQIIGGDLQLQGTEISLTKDFVVDDRTTLWLKGAVRVCGLSVPGRWFRPLPKAIRMKLFQHASTPDKMSSAGAFDWRTRRSMLGFKLRPGKGLSVYRGSSYDDAGLGPSAPVSAYVYDMIRRICTRVPVKTTEQCCR